MARVAPKGCIVRHIQLDGKGGAELRYGCDGRYASRIVRASRVRFGGATIGKNARVDFVLSPEYAVCHKYGREIVCHLEGRTAARSAFGTRALSGTRKRRRKKSTKRSR